MYERILLKTMENQEIKKTAQSKFLKLVLKITNRILSSLFRWFHEIFIEWTAYIALWVANF